MELSCWAGLLLLTASGPLLTGADTQPRFAQPIGNQEVVASRQATLKCVVENLGRYQVAWIHLERQMILSIHDKVITSIPRFRLVQDDPNTWVLHISQVQRSDGGLYMCQVNTAPLMSQVGSLKVFEAPEIVDANSTGSEVSVRSRGNVTLKCAARGVPQPTIQWVREDGRPLRVSATHHGRHGHRGRHGHQHGRHSQHGRHTQHGPHSQHGRYEGRRHYDHAGQPGTEQFIQHGYDGERAHNASHLPTSIESDTLHLVHVTPSDMGSYLCIANNRIPPTVSKRIQLFVEFKPMIWVPNQLVGGARGRSVTLQCRSEAHPKPIVYWTKKMGDKHQLIIDERREKYDIRTPEMSEYETEILLTIHHLNASDFGSYKCVCENYIGKVHGSITLNEIEQPTTELVTTDHSWQLFTETDPSRAGGGERDGTHDVYLPEDGDLERQELGEEMERDRKRYKPDQNYKRDPQSSTHEDGKSPATRTACASPLPLAALIYSLL